MKGVVGWIAGSLWGGKPADESPASPQQHADAAMHDDDYDDEEERNPNDDTVDYDDEEDEEQDEMPQEPQSAAARNHTRPAQTMAAGAVPHTPLQASAASSALLSPTPAHSRVALSAFSPAQSLPTHSFGGVAATPISRHVPLSSMASPSPLPLSSPSGAPAAAATPAQLLRSAFAHFGSGATGLACDLLSQLGHAGGDAQIDALVLALVRRTGDSRHVTSQRAAMEQTTDVEGDDADSLVLTSELRHKAGKYDALLAFVRHPLLQGPAQQMVSLWSRLSHASQHALLQQGEFIECCLSLKQLLNAGPVSFRDERASASASASAVDPSDEALVLARRQLMLQCMELIVREMRWQHGASVLIKEGLSVQEIFFSETSKMPEIFVAVEKVLLHQAAQPEAPVAAVQYTDLMRLHAATSLLHCVMVAGASFRAAPAHAALFSEMNLPQASAGQTPSLSWMLQPDVARVVKLLSQRVSEQIVALAPGVRVVGFPSSSAAAVARPNVASLFSVQSFQASMFDFIYRADRVYLMQYTEFLALVEQMRVATGAAGLAAHVTDLENKVHGEFVADRALLVQHLSQSSRRMSEYNYELSAVFPVPVGKGLPGVPAPALPPYQALYDFAQEFQDLSALVGLSLSEPVRAVADRRLVFFLAFYGHPFMQQLFEEQLASGEIARLLDLAPLAREMLPSFLREKAASTGVIAGDDFSIPGAQGLQRVGADGVADDGLPVYDSWLAQLLRPYPHFAWLHSLSMQQYGDAHKLLLRQAHGEKQSLQHKKHLLSLSKLALLADSGEGEAVRAASDASLATDSSASDAINTNELQALDDQLYVMLAQEFLTGLYAPPEEEQQQEQGGKQAVLPTAELIARLTQAGLDNRHPSSARLHSFMWAFMSMEKSFLPKSRSTPLESYSTENQDAMTNIWKGVVEADADSWSSISSAKSSDASDEWKSGLMGTQLFLVWRELLRPDRQCCQWQMHTTDHHEHVYTASFRRLLKHSNLLDSALRANDVRIVMENAHTEAKAEAQQLAAMQH